MNYWPAEVTGLSACHMPLLDFVIRLAERGERPATVNYGARGWVAHHNTDLWAHADPVGDYGQGDPVWTMWPMGGVWLALHLWDHVDFTLDIDWLREHAWAPLAGAARFCLDFLYEDEDGHLITGPSTSPEHKFLWRGKPVSVSAAATMDLQLIGGLFDACLAAAELADIEDEIVDEIREARPRLKPMQVGQEGRLQEWSVDFEDHERQHRHVSHLLGVYPGMTITEGGTPELWAAARRSLEIRGDEATGWGMGWRACLWARFRDGDHARVILQNMLRSAIPSQGSGQRGGLYPNLFSAHPPFQIDGNYAFPAAVAEMLMQSHLGAIDLLPALPDAWAEGEVHGLVARGAVSVSMGWSEGTLDWVELTNLRSEPRDVRFHIADASYEVQLEGEGSFRQRFSDN